MLYNIQANKQKTQPKQNTNLNAGFNSDYVVCLSIDRKFVPNPSNNFLGQIKIRSTIAQITDIWLRALS